MFTISTDLFIITFLLFFVMILSIRFRKLTVPAAIAGGIMGMIIFIGSWFTGIVMLGTFFLTGILATSFKKEYKHPIKPEDTLRTAGQVFANGGVATIMAALAFLYPLYDAVCILMMSASIAAATADTLSSELGMVYGKRFYNILTWKKEEKGPDGVISLEGTLIGIIGASLIAVIYGYSFGFNSDILIIIIAGTAGNLADSVLGASLERRNYIGNNMVNFLNTLLAAAAAWGLNALRY